MKARGQLARGTGQQDYAHAARFGDKINAVPDALKIIDFRRWAARAGAFRGLLSTVEAMPISAR
jgi:regulator of protease activity HflC (stomatin/prohibitin superfamily)